ncbi:MAG: hypothetical protein P4M13_06660 [Alphaproteobacteria bacterium]|nr:hypothetical protein [Alphaproteobacteria bacterium]
MLSQTCWLGYIEFDASCINAFKSLGGMLAISSIEFRFLEQAKKAGILPVGGKILEFGEANTNRINAHKIDVCASIISIMADCAERESLLARAEILQSHTDLESRYEEAKMLYKALFGYISYTAIDLLPPAEYRLQQDLNKPFDLKTRYDVCINNGTTEHVFNQANCYEMIHNHTQAGGVMIHWTPCIGWVNHGLFHVQPGFFYDLAQANGYEIRFAKLATVAALYDLKPGGVNEDVFTAHPDLRNALACVVLRKTVDAPFKFPLQGKYSELSQYLGED